MSPKLTDSEILVAADSGVITVDGTEYQFTKDVTRIRSSHPAVKAAPHLFKKLEVHYDVEQATAAPGEKRGEKS